MKRRIITGVLLLALAALLGLTYRSDRLLFELPAETARRHFEKIGHALARHHGVFFLMTFDESRPVEWIVRNPVLYPGTERIPGRLGHARRFDGRASTHIETSALWPDLGSNYTLSLWVDLESTGMDQDIWYTFIQEQHTGFKLSDSQMTFSVPGRPEQVAAYPFAAFGRFVHLAGVVDGFRSEARLYENGICMATVPVAEVIHPAQNLEFGKTRLYAATAPFRGALDEAAAWRRALAPEEIRALARARHSLPRTLEPFPYWRWRLVHNLSAAIPAALRILDRFNPLLHEGRAGAADLPVVALHFSSGDSRHFIRAHEASLASGRRTARGANPRRIFAQCGGKTVEAQAWLDGSDTRYASGRRPGFIVETPAAEPLLGTRRLRLRPPENLEAEWPRIANVPAGGLCRLTVNGLSKGIYVYDSYDQCGLKPGERTWVADGPHNPADWQAVFRGARPLEDADPAALPVAGLETGLDRVRGLLAGDLFHPWSSREWSWRIRKCPAAPEAPPDAAPSPYAVLGSNPSPDYVTGDLDLHGFRGAPPDIAWRSSRPNLIDAAGRVTRPTGDCPVGVELTATFRKDGQPVSSVLRFRVMPAHPKLSALMLYIEESLSGTQRVDFQARYHPAAAPDIPRQLAGGQATGGGIKHHGNTSYWRGRKKPFSLRFDGPHGLLGPANATHLYLLNGYVDATKMHNKLVFDLFRAFGNGRPPRFAPEIDWTEVFVNGRYLGVYEMCTRIDEDLLGFAEGAANPAASPVLYKMRPDPLLFTRDQTDAFEQAFPSPSKTRAVQPLMDLLRTASQPDPAGFVREIETVLDLDNAIDFFLLLNFAGNVDGRTTNFYLARNGGPGARFFFIPWDYDHTFMAETRWLSNALFDRLRSEVPGFRARTRQRWRELRQGPLAPAALDARIDAMAARLEGFMDWEYALMGSPVPPDFAGQVAELKRGVRAHAEYVDAKLGLESPAPASPP